MDVQLKYRGRHSNGLDCVHCLGAEDAITSPCSAEGHCYNFTRDLEIPLGSSAARFETLTACYLEDGRLVAQGQITVRHLMEIAESRPPEAQNNATCLPYTSDPKDSTTANPDSSTSTASSTSGAKWIELTDKAGKALHLSLAMKVQDGHASEKASNRTELRIEEKRREGDVNSFYRLSKIQAFEYLVDCVLEFEKCSKRQLNVGERAQWLLDALASRFGIGTECQHLLYLAWIFKTQSQTVTKYCMEFLLEKYRTIHQKTWEWKQVTATLRKVTSQIEMLCGTALENYFRMGDEFESGLCEMNSCSAPIQCPPTALEPTVTLLSLLFQSHQTKELGSWYEERLKTAALMKYRRIEEKCRVEGCQVPISDVEGSDDSEEKENNKEDNRAYADAAKSDPMEIYLKLKRLCTSLTLDLKRDIQIRRSAILPDAVHLPRITAGVYSQELKHHLIQSMDSAPPKSPSPPVVDAFLAVGVFHDYLLTHVPPEANSKDAYLNPVEIFSYFIEEWMHGSQEMLCNTCESALTDRHLFDVEEGQRVPRLMIEVLSGLHDEVRLYKRLVEYWPCVGMALERLICDVLRYLTAMISQECRMYRIQPAQKLEHRKTGMAAWEWETVSDFEQRTPSRSEPLLSPSQVLLLHALHKLMVELPQFEALLTKWAQPQLQREGNEHVGCECGLLTQELRSQFTSAIVFTCQKLVHALSVGCRIDFAALLLQIDSSCPEGATPSEVQTCATSHFECLNQGLLDILPHLDDRVYISLIRGLWDCISRDLFLFAVDLREDQIQQLHNPAWRNRVHCSVLAEACDSFFHHFLSDNFSHTLSQSDTIPPMHARKTREMFDKNTKYANNTFSVY